MLILQVHVKHSSLKKEVYNPQAFILHAVLLRQAFRPLRKIPHCCLPQEFGPCLSANVAVHPLRPATDRRHSVQLPPYLANQTQDHLQAKFLSLHSVSGISIRFQKLSPSQRQILTCYSPVRHSHISEDILPFDLHVLCTLPAFLLSQDQTLHDVFMNPIQIECF